MKYKFQIDKKVFEIEVANSATFHSVTPLKVDRMPHDVLVGDTNEGGDPSSIFVDNRLFRIEVVRDEGGYPTGIFVNDEYYPAGLLKIDRLFFYKEKPVSASKSGVVKSFIPGAIKKVFYRAGDRVEENDIILIHEAMKMENEIRAPKDGVIKSFGVQEGDNILANHLLFEIE